MTLLLIFFGKLVSFLSKTLNLGGGATWPGHIALSVNKNFIRDLLKTSKTRVVVVAGTNGKTTTTKLLQTIFVTSGKSVIVNTSGANLLNGIASSLLLRSSILGNLSHDFAVFEIDENSLPLALAEFTPDYLVLLNIFRDQLDRYGETDVIMKKWKNAVSDLPASTTLILNADDPQIVFIGKNARAKISYFGLGEKGETKLAHAADAVHCPNCGNKLEFERVYLSHAGEWECPSCKIKTPPDKLTKAPSYPVVGVYNKYNIHAAVLTAKNAGIAESDIERGLLSFKPAFGRQEKIKIGEKTAQIFLSKNPTSMNESLRTVAQLNPKTMLIVLNDRIPDGRDVSWIWDVDFEDFLSKQTKLVISGDRCYDMGLRIKYASEYRVSNIEYQIEKRLEKAIKTALQKTPQNETLYVVPTYSAMLDVRKILKGRKIL